MTVKVKTFENIAVNKREALRYAGGGDACGEILPIFNECVSLAEASTKNRVCYKILPVSVKGSLCDFGEFSLFSKDLAKNLGSCNRVILFAATVGVEIDRLILRFGKISPTKALLLQAIGSERAESLCDEFCSWIEQELKVKLKPRFSAGYGDLPLEAQKQIFASLDCAKNIGVTLNDSLLMSPSKSVTAFVGIEEFL